MTGAANLVVIFLLWLLYFSLVSVGQNWFSFGWESQLLETGFLAIWSVPLLRWSQFPPGLPSPWVCVWGYRWLVFRIMLGAGLIKVRGDQCWRDLTCMNYFYQTQPKRYLSSSSSNLISISMSLISASRFDFFRWLIVLQGLIVGGGTRIDLF